MHCAYTPQQHRIASHHITHNHNHSGAFQFRAVARYARGVFRASDPSAPHNASEWRWQADAAGGTDADAKQLNVAPPPPVSPPHPAAASAADTVPSTRAARIGSEFFVSDSDSDDAYPNVEYLFGAPIDDTLRAPGFRVERGAASIAVHFVPEPASQSPAETQARHC